MRYLIYKTTCLATGKFYIGQRQTNLLNDSYLGSGMILKQAIKKYGKDSFVREILFELKTKEEMNKKEADIVNEDMLLNPLCMNLSPGGQGGYLGKEAVQKQKDSWTNERRQEQSKRFKERRSSFVFTYTPLSDEIRNKISKTLTGHKQSAETKLKRANSNRGKKRTEETKALMSQNIKERYKDGFTAEHVSKLSHSAKNRPTVQCPHCNKIGQICQMGRWHFDNCKSLRSE